MIPDGLKTFTKTVKYSKIKLRENGRQAVFLNPERTAYFVIHVDGELIKNAVACDYVLAKNGTGEVCVELKGTDVDHAVEQVYATALHWQENGWRFGKIAALIVCTKKPVFDTKVARFATLFAKKFKGPLHVIPKNTEFLFERVLAFDGPI
jgi:hypothetical protein